MSDGPRLVPLASAPWQMAQSASHVRRTLGGGGGAVWERGPAAARGRKRTGAEAAMTNGSARRRVPAVPKVTPAAAAAPAPGETLPTSFSLNRIGIVERFLDRMVAHDWDAMADCLSDDVERVGPFCDTYRGKAAYVAFISDLLPQLAGYAMKVDRVVYAGAVAVAELTETVDSTD